MTRRKKKPDKRGRKPLSAAGPLTAAQRTHRYRAKVASHESEIAESWLRLALLDMASGREATADMTPEIETLRRSGALDLLRSRLGPEARERLDELGRRVEATRSDTV